MDKFYILEGKTPKQVELFEWARWFETGNRIVEQTKLGEAVKVSTVFLGLNHSYGLGPPELFETMVFGGELDGDMDRYSTWEEAEEGHHKMCIRVLETTGI